MKEIWINLILILKIPVYKPYSFQIYNFEKRKLKVWYGNFKDIENGDKNEYISNAIHFHKIWFLLRKFNWLNKDTCNMIYSSL